MRTLKMLAFISIGLVAVFGGISLILITVGCLLAAIIAKDAILIVCACVLWFIEMFIVNWVLYDFHGE